MGDQTIAVSWDSLWEDDVRFPQCHSLEQLRRLFPEVNVVFAASFNEDKQPLAFWCESQWSEQPQDTLRELRRYIGQDIPAGTDWCPFEYCDSRDIRGFVGRF